MKNNDKTIIILLGLILACVIASLTVCGPTVREVSPVPDGTYIKVDPDDIYVVETPIDPDPPTCEDDPYMVGCACVPPEVGTGYPDCEVPPPVDPCIENPEADGCPCPDGDEVYPNCPVEPPSACDQKPTAVADYDTVEGSGINLIDNDQWNCDERPIAQKRSDPTYGTVSVNSNGTYTYTMSPEYVGNVDGDSFEYAARNSVGRGNSVKVTLGDGVTPPPPVDCNEFPDDPSCPEIPVDCDEFPDDPSCPEPPTDCDENPDDFDCLPVIPPQDVGEKYLEAVVTYKPDFPPLGDYSVPGACEAVTDESAPQVTLQDRERLYTAWERLVAANNNNPAGAILNIPWDVDIIQCDDLRFQKVDNTQGPITVRGIPGPNGELPRMYCRSETRDGTVPRADVIGDPIYAGNLGGRTLMVENLHIDGYKKLVTLPSSGVGRYRNLYLHHGMSNGFSQSNSEGSNNVSDVEICGVEVSHVGTGNVEHGIYAHRALGENSYNSLTIVDSFFHSTPYSSNIKSTAQINTILNNRIYGTADTDPSYTRRYSSMNLDLISCGKNEIRGNDIKNTKTVATSYGDIIIGIRNRKLGVRGCDDPLMWSRFDRPPVYIAGPAHTDEYWDELGGEIRFETIIEDNTIEAAGEFADKYYTYTAYGTYPNYTNRLGGSSCWLPTPMSWYERSRVYVNNNTYTNINMSRLTRNAPPSHNYSGDCEFQNEPPGPGPSTDMIEVM